MTTRGLLLAAMLLVPPATAGANGEAWRCVNDIEVQCTAEACTAATEADAFTPMALEFDASGAFSLCAYSGCLEGRGSIGPRAPFLVLSQAQVRRSGPGVEAREDVLIAFHPQDRIALVKAGGLATPLHCVRKESGAR